MGRCTCRRNRELWWWARQNGLALDRVMWDARGGVNERLRPSCSALVEGWRSTSCTIAPGSAPPSLQNASPQQSDTFPDEVLVRETPMPDSVEASRHHVAHAVIEHMQLWLCRVAIQAVLPASPTKPIVRLQAQSARFLQMGHSSILHPHGLTLQNGDGLAEPPWTRCPDLRLFGMCLSASYLG